MNDSGPRDPGLRRLLADELRFRQAIGRLETAAAEQADPHEAE